MDKQTIYIVTSGDYSDYRIEGVFSNKEDAEYLADIITENSYNSAEVERYIINNYDKSGIEKVCFWNFDYDPKLDAWTVKFNTEITQWETQTINNVEKNRYGCYTVTTRGKSKEEAHKIANEKVMQAIARDK